MNIVYDLILVAIGAIIGVFVTNLYSNYNDDKRFKEKIDSIAPLIREELQENLELCHIWIKVDWNKFFRGDSLVKKFKNEKLTLYEEEITRWSLKNNSKLHSIKGLVNEINEVLASAHGQYVKVNPLGEKINTMNNIMLGLPEPFHVSK